MIAGKDKGKKGAIDKVINATNKVIVGGINKAKIHIKPTATAKGSIVERDMPLHASNVMLVDAKGKGMRVSKKSKDLKIK